MRLRWLTDRLGRTVGSVEDVYDGNLGQAWLEAGFVEPAGAQASAVEEVMDEKEQTDTKADGPEKPRQSKQEPEPHTDRGLPRAPRDRAMKGRGDRSHRPK